MEKRERRARGTTHIPDWIAARILNKLDPQDARLLAQLLNDENGSCSCYFFDGSWVVDSIFPKNDLEQPDFLGDGR